uniref:Integrase catalytic domain-containing protein n=1 Tax=Trichogramma kaykai TaxID=54128 RepID=A0ABD2WDS1_9HYME
MTRRVVDRPWVVVAADMIEFPRSKNQNKYLLVFQDLFTRWIEVVPLKKATGANVLRAFEELVLFRWETPEFFLTDNGKEFDNGLLNAALEEYGVKHLFTPPYHA